MERSLGGRIRIGLPRLISRTCCAEAQIVRYPMGRKQYNGGVPKAFPAEMLWGKLEELYRPRILEVGDVRAFLRKAAEWVWFYNMERVHLGRGMEGKTPWEKFQEIYGVSGVEPVFPVVLLDDLSVLYVTQFLPKMDGVGQSLLKRYTPG